jgi:DNA-binding response OmpR family regulator
VENNGSNVKKATLMKTLISEDDLMSRAFLTAALKKQGHDVVSAMNGILALALMS